MVKEGVYDDRSRILRTTKLRPTREITFKINMPLQSLPNETLSKPASGHFSFSLTLEIVALNSTEVRESDEGQDVLDDKALKDFALLRRRLKGSKHSCAYRKGVSNLSLVFAPFLPCPLFLSTTPTIIV